MSETNWIAIITVQGELQAELLRGLLEAQGITVQLSQEGVARVYGFSVGPLAEVDILVPENQTSIAEEVIARYQAGEFEDAGDSPAEPDETL